MKDLFDTEEKKQRAVGQFRQLLSDPGWLLVVDVINANIEVLKDQIIAGDGTREQMDRLRDSLIVHKSVRDTPTTLIKEFTEEDVEEPRTDPFDTVADVKKRDIDT